MIDQIFVRIGGIIDCYSAKPGEEVPGLNTDKSVNTDITDVSCVAIDLIANVAMLFDVLTAGTAIKFFADFHANERPLRSRSIKIACH